MSYLTGATNAQSLNGILTITDGVITISEGTISGLEEIDLNDLQVADTATIENLIVNNQIDMTNGQIKNVSDPTDNGDAANKQFIDTNFLNKTTTTSQNVAGKLTFNNTTTDILSNPVIKFENNINSSSNGMVLQFKKNLINQPNLQIGGLVWLDQAASLATRRVCEMIVSNDSTSLPLFDIKFSSGVFNPLTIANTQTILRNNDFYLINKTTAQTLLRYLNSNDEWEMFKPLDMNSNKIISLAEPTLAQDASTKNYTDTASVNTNYLKRDGTLAMTGNLQMGSYNITNLLDPANLSDAATKNYTDTQTANTNYLLRNGTLPMTGNLNLSTHDLITTGTIDCNIIDANGNIVTTADMSCADFTSTANQVIGGTSANVLDVKSSAFFEADVLIESNKHLAFNSGTLSTTNGMLIRHTGAVGFLDVRGSEFRIRTSASATPDTIRFKVNDTNTTVINNFFVDGNTTFGNNVAVDTTTFNSKANFPSGSELKFNSGADLLLQSGATTTFAGGSTTTFNSTANLRFEGNSSCYFFPGAYLEYSNIQYFLTGSYIESARINLIRKTTDYALSNLSFENGIISDPDSSGLIITMPNTGGATGLYWNRRHYIIKLQDGGQTKLRQNTQTISTKIDEFTGDINYNIAFKTIQLVFDEKFNENGQIHIISER